MSAAPKASFRVSPAYQPLLRALRLDGAGIFTDSRIIAWRKLPDRENCTLDADVGSGWTQPTVRLHVKRYVATRGITPAEEEARGHLALTVEKIPTAPLVGYGIMADGRSFAIFEDLKGFTPADKLVGSGTSFAVLLDATADLAADLHARGLHHRDLYLCHFMACVGRDRSVDLRLIDTARIRRLPRFLTRRWIVKDLAQFWYSTTKLPITDAQRIAWLQRYGQHRRLTARQIESLQRSIQRKARAIGWHDRRLNEERPGRNVSIPSSTPGRS